MSIRGIPTDITTAVAAIGAGMVVAALANGGRRGDTPRSMLAALSAGIVGVLLILQLVIVLSSFGPASLIPDLASSALTAADDLAQSRNEVQDPYVAVAFLGFLLAAALSVTAITSRTRQLRH